MAFNELITNESATVAATLCREQLVGFDELFTSDDAPPTARGVYAWYQTIGALPGVPADDCPGTDHALLYIGISPAWKAANGTLRSRLASHHHGPIGSSTFRRTLTAFLWQREGWEPYWKDRAVLPGPDLQKLGDWQRRHLHLRWVLHERPWEIEAGIIAQLKPPLNVAHNRDHPFRPNVIAARKNLTLQARKSPRI